MSNKIFVALNADGVGDKIGSAVLADDHQGLSKLSSSIKNAHNMIDEWVVANGGRVVASSGDENIFMIPEEAFGRLGEIKNQYTKTTGHSLTVGTGSSLSEASKALIYGKLHEKGAVVQYDPSLEEYLSSDDQDRTNEQGDEEEIEENLDGDMGEEEFMTDNEEEFSEDPDQEDMEEFGEENDEEFEDTQSEPEFDEETGQSESSMPEQDGSEDEFSEEGSEPTGWESQEDEVESETDNFEDSDEDGLDDDLEQNDEDELLEEDQDGDNVDDNDLDGEMEAHTSDAMQDEDSEEFPTARAIAGPESEDGEEFGDEEDYEEEDESQFEDGEEEEFEDEDLEEENDEEEELEYGDEEDQEGSEAAWGGLEQDGSEFGAQAQDLTDPGHADLDAYEMGQAEEDSMMDEGMGESQPGHEMGMTDEENFEHDAMENEEDEMDMDNIEADEEGNIQDDSEDQILDMLHANMNSSSGAEEDPNAPQQANMDVESMRQEILDSLMAFRENKEFLEQQRDANPMLYQSLLTVLRNMIEMAKQLNINPEQDMGQMDAQQGFEERMPQDGQEQEMQQPDMTEQDMPEEEMQESEEDQFMGKAERPK